MSEKAPWDEPEKAPWEVSANEELPSLMTPITEEQHPSFSLADREIPKNTGNSPESTVLYLKKKHPELTIKHQSGRILAKAPGEENWRVLDPETGFDPFSWGGIKEAGKDVLDVGYETLAGLAQGAASTAAAVPAAISTGGVGAIPAAMAAGGASGAGLEALRQAIGKALGIPQEMSGKDIAMAGAFGTVMPGVLGAGLTKGALQGAAKKELTAEALQKILSGGRGLGGRTWDFGANTLLPAWGEAASGISRTSMKKAIGGGLPELKRLESKGVTKAVTDLSEDVYRLGSAAGDKKGKAVADAMRGNGTLIDLEAIRAPYLKVLEEAKQEAARLPVDSSKFKVSELKDVADKMFNVDDEVTLLERLAAGEEPARVSLPAKLDPEAVFLLQKKLGKERQFYKMDPSKLSKVPVGSSEAESAIKGAVGASYKAAGDQLSKATDGLSDAAKKEYADHLKLMDSILPSFSTPQSAFNALSNIDKPGKKVLLENIKELSESTGVDLLEPARNLQMLRELGKPALLSQSNLGSTSTHRSIPLGAAGATAGYLLARKAGADHATALAAAGLGAGAGNILGGPAMTRRLIEAEAALRKQAAKSAPVTRPTLFGGGQTAWDVLQQRDE